MFTCIPGHSVHSNWFSEHALPPLWQMSPELLAAVPPAVSAMGSCPTDAGVVQLALEFLSNMCVERTNQVRWSWGVGGGGLGSGMSAYCWSGHLFSL